MNPVITRHEPLHLAGISGPLPPRSAPPGKRPEAIQALWRALAAQVAEISNRRGAERYAVIEGDVLESGVTPTFRAMVAVDSFAGLPAWCERFTVAPGRYAVFEHRGLPREMSQTVAGIYANWVPKIPGLLTLDLEVMCLPPGYDPTDAHGSFAYWLPLP